MTPESFPNSVLRNTTESISPGEVFRIVDLRKNGERGDDPPFFDAWGGEGKVLRIELFPSDSAEPLPGDPLLRNRLISVGKKSRDTSQWEQEDPFLKYASASTAGWTTVSIRIGEEERWGELPFNLGAARSFYRRIAVVADRLTGAAAQEAERLWPLELVWGDESTPPKELTKREKKRGARLLLIDREGGKGRWKSRNRFLSGSPEERARAAVQWEDERFLRRHPAHWLIRWSRRLILPLALLVLIFSIGTPVELRPDRRLPVVESEEGGVRYVTSSSDRYELRRWARFSLYRFNRRFPTEDQIASYLKKSKTAAGVSEFRFPSIPMKPYSERERKAYHFYTSLFGDSITYPTDYWWAGNPQHHRIHNGIDLAAPPGTLISSPLSGRAFAGEGFLGGVFIGVQDGKRAVLLAHCDRRLFFEGDSVRAGDPIATVGMTGKTSGPHIHLMTGLADPKGKNSAGPLRVEWIDPVEWYHRELAR